MNLPSKELLSEVLGINMPNLITSIEVISNELVYKTVLDTNKINIYELQYKCKEWAFEQGFTVTSSKDDDVTWCVEMYNYCADDINNYVVIDEFDDFDADTEPEAVFKACQWILENR